MTLENTTPDSSQSKSAPATESLETILARLPEAYAAWERGMANPALDRIQRRVSELLREGEASQTDGETQPK